MMLGLSLVPTLHPDTRKGGVDMDILGLEQGRLATSRERRIVVAAREMHFGQRQPSFTKGRFFGDDVLQQAQGLPGIAQGEGKNAVIDLGTQLGKVHTCTRSKVRGRVKSHRKLCMDE